MNQPPQALAAFLAEAGEQLRRLEKMGRRRRLQSPNGRDFCSNDYLGLANDPAIARALEAALRSGLPPGAASARLIRGEHPAFAELEQQFAAFCGAEAALFFSSGYAANCGLLSAVAGKNDLYFSDALNHASIIDGMRLSGAGRVVFPHLDLDALQQALRRHPRVPHQNRFVVVESIYSMEGDRAPLRELARLCAAAGALLIVDESHATGIFGPRGEGCVAEDGVREMVLASMHTCGKAFGAAGALVAGSRTLRDLLINRARTFVFATAPPPLLPVQIAAALDLSLAEPHRRVQVRRLARQLRTAVTQLATRFPGLAPPLAWAEPESPIIPIVLGTEQRAVAVAEMLRQRGFDIRAIRPPTVPEGAARLRVTVHASQTAPEVDELLSALEDILTREHQ